MVENGELSLSEIEPCNCFSRTETGGLGRREDRFSSDDRDQFSQDLKGKAENLVC